MYYSQFVWVIFLSSSTDVHDVSVKFSGKYLEIIKKYIPIKTVTIRLNDKPWFNSTIRKVIRIRDRLHKQLKNSNSINLLAEYRTQRNKVNKMIKHAREHSFVNVDKLLNKDACRNAKSYWKLVKKLMGKCSSSSIPPLFNATSGELTVNDVDKANLLNSFFCSISDIDDTNVEMSNENKLDIPRVTCEEIKDVIETLKLGKAVVHDKISREMLKYSAPTVCKPLEIIFNYSLNTGEFPLM